jgi:predicted secreted hydrolase
MVRFLFSAFALLALLGAAVFISGGWGSRQAPEVRTSLSVSQILGGAPAASFARALKPRAFRFPEDHGPHPDFRTEWWYLTGNLSGPDGDPYGFQLTIFRSALRPPVGDPEQSSLGVSSLWRADQVYMGHLALTDGKNGAFHAFERFSRGAGGLAGATAQPFRVWLEDWEIVGPAGAANDIFPLQLRAVENHVGVSLTLNPAKALVLQGEQGLSQKGPEPGNASYYYSFTRLEANGEIQLGSETARVEGFAWMDREWSTSALSPGQVGWDWFALQLNDGSDLMYYQLRLEDGSPHPLSKGILVGSTGESSVLNNSEVQLNVLDLWKSPLDGMEYPSGWRLAVASENLVLTLTPVLPDQELNLTFRYWEGAVRIAGIWRGKEIGGRGYVELTGYTDSGTQGRSGRLSRTPTRNQENP